MTSASDDVLTRPLGLAPLAAPSAWPRALRPAPVLAALLSVALGALLAYVAAVRDPLGGEPHAVAAIEMRAPPLAAAAPAPAEPPPGTTPGRRTADEVETASGVSVVRPQGAVAPDAVVIQVPSDEAPRLAPAPDRRLTERGRYGTLPKRDGALPARAAPAGRIALVLTGLGIGQAATAQAVTTLPPAVTLAFAPYGTDLERAVARAREAGHEVMLQVPMEPFDYPDNDPGPQTLMAAASPAQNLDRLAWSMSRFTGYAGVITYMGARLTGEAGALEPILRELGARGLGVLDDATSPRALVAALGAKLRVPAARADAVIDAVPRADALDRELARLEEQARRTGFALGSATALPLTIERVARWSRDLAARGILLVPASRALRTAR